MRPSSTDHRRGSLATSRIMNVFLKVLKRRLESQMAKTFDPTLSRKIDCVIYLLEN